MSDTDQGRWLVVQPRRLRVRRWNDEVVVYDDRSGDTHLLDDACGRVLERLLTARASDEDLAALFAGPEASPESPSESPEARLYCVLDRLRRLGLVKPLRK